MNQEIEDRIPWGWVAVMVLALEAALVLSAFAWVATYSYLIHPGEPATYYEDYARSVSPIVSIVLGIPFWFFAARWVGRKAGTRAVATGLCAWLILFIIEMPVNFFASSLYIWIMVILSHSTKLLAAYCGGKAALNDTLRMRRALEQ